MDKLSTRIGRWAEKNALGRKLAIVLTIVSFGSAIATYVAITDTSLGAGDTETVIILLQIDLVLFLLLALVVMSNLVSLWRERRRRLIGTHLHTRLVVLFSLVALAPAVVVSVFSAAFFNFSLDSWFSDRVRRAIVESRAVAELYLKEHLQVIRGDILAMARDLDRAALVVYGNPRQFNRIVGTQGVLRNLNEAYVFDGTGRVLARYRSSFILDDPPAPVEVMQRARQGEVVLLSSDTEDRVRALTKLEGFVDTFLYVGRYVEPKVLEHIQNTQAAAKRYEDIEGQRSAIEVTFAMVYILVSLLLLLVAVRVGLTFANRMSRPISQLARAADRVRSGDLSARVKERANTDELALLARAFNRMASQVESQREELVLANQQLDERRHFIETVLSGVTVGVIGLDDVGRIKISNRSASMLMGTNLEEETGTELTTLVKETDEMIATARQRPDQPVECEIEFGEGRTLLVRLACDVQKNEIVGFVATFDDITELVSAQRKAVWADVARRIAHEIKNPLTPIQLSAERLKKKYLPEVKSDPDTFSDCTDTIVRQVGDIGRMVDEFSAFARIPSPEMSPQDIVRLCREALVLPKNAHPEISFESRLPDEPLEIPCDQRQISQVLTNLIQNAVEAIEARTAPSDQTLPAGKVELILDNRPDRITIEIADNGCGLPEGKRSRLVEPYVTTRGERGTGLGLAIVKKIVEDHQADFALEDRQGGGARAKVIFDLSREPYRRDPASVQEVADGV